MKPYNLQSDHVKFYLTLLFKFDSTDNVYMHNKTSMQNIQCTGPYTEYLVIQYNQIGKGHRNIT